MRSLRILLAALAALIGTALVPWTAVAQDAPFCLPGQPPDFVLGFADLRAAVGAPMGQPLECEHTEVSTADAHQQTTTGLSFYRKSTNTPTFTNGYEHWALTSAGLVCWMGESIDPPATAQPCEGAPPPPPAGLSGPVTRVVDGDTLDVQLASGEDVRVRVIGLDTPETVAPGQPVDCYGPEASARARELLSGATVTLQPDPTQDAMDAFGRTLAYVLLPDGQSFGEVMIREGYGREYTFRTAYQHQAAHLSAQGAAQAADRGLWGACAMGPVPPPTAPAPVPLLPPPPPPADYTGPFNPVGPDRDCGDFRTHRQAQAFFEAARQLTGQRDRHRLDSDADGIACETLS